jgi:eukaryotic-like serine/threonine-protein kinase
LSGAPPSIPGDARATHGRFELIAPLGTGAFGDVVLARDRLHGGQVALKRLRRRDARAIARFKRELRLLAELRHPSLAVPYELVHDGDYWLVMEHVPGVSFLEHATGGVDRIRRLLLELGNALSALHDAGFLHGDVADANLRVTPDGRLVLLDFGMAVQQGVSSRHFGHLTTVAPEQLEGSELGPATDWYAVGALLFTALTGREPYEGTYAQVLARKMREDAPSVATKGPEVPMDLATLTDALLCRDPESRMARARPHLHAMGIALSSSRPATMFVGRREELRRLDEALTLARASEGVVHVRITGESGIGKTELVERFLARLQGIEALFGRAYAQQAVPFGGLDMVVEALLTRAADCGSPLDERSRRLLERTLGAAEQDDDVGTMDEDALARAAEALASLLCAVAGEKPPVVVIDDAQWADADAARLLARALAEVQRPALVLTIVRDGEADRGFASTFDTRAPPRLVLPLAPLAAGEVELLSRAHGFADGQAILDATGGLPIFVTEMLRGGEGRTLAEAMAQRMGALPAPERTLLLALSVAARPLEPALAFAVAEHLGVAHPFGAFLGLRAARLLHAPAAHGGALTAAHASIAEASLAIDGARTDAVHVAFDVTMEHLGVDDPEAHAVHAARAGRRTRAMELTIVAAERAARALAYDRAGRLYDEAAALVPPAGRARGRTLSRLAGDAFAAAGRGEDATRAYGHALDGRTLRLDEPETIDLARMRATQLLHAGRVDQGSRMLAEVFRAAKEPFPSARGAVFRLGAQALAIFGGGTDVRASDTPDARAVALADLCFSAGVALTNVDTLRGAEFVTRSFRIARRAGDVRRAARSLSFVACYACNLGPKHERRLVRLMDQVDALAARADEPFMGAMKTSVRCLFAFHMGRYEECAALAQAAEGAFRAIEGAVRERVTAQSYRCVSLAMLGQFDELAKDRARLFADGEARRDHFACTNASTGMMNLAFLAAGDPARARHEAEQAMARWTHERVTLQHFFDLLAHARIDLYEGHPAAAWKRIVRARPSLDRGRILRTTFVRATFLELEARAALEAGAGGAPRVVRRNVRALRRLGAPYALPFADVLEGALAARRGDGARARTLLLRALDGYLVFGMRAHAASVDLHLAEVGEARRVQRLPSVRDEEALARALAPSLR